jgi:hypothetical protein
MSENITAPTYQPAKPKKTHISFAALHPSLRIIKASMAEVDGFNAKFAVLVTRLVGTMWCAYLFTVIALLGLQPALKPGGEGLIAWIAQTFIQLVLLSIIMVGQNVQSIAADNRAISTYNDTVETLNRLNINTEGGVRDLAVLLDSRFRAIEKNLGIDSPPLLPLTDPVPAQPSS